MKKIPHIAFNDIRLIVKDKMFFFWVLAFPMLFIFIFGSLYKGGTSSTKAALTVINQDKGKWGSYLLEKVKSPDIDIIIPADNKEPKEFTRMLIIPADFSQKIEAKKAQSLLLEKKSGSSLTAESLAEIKITQAFVKIITELILYGDKDIKTFFESKLADKNLAQFKNLLEIKSQFPEGTITKIPSGFDHVIPGILIQFVMMVILINGGISVMEDRKRGVLIRLLYSPLSYRELFLSKFLGRFLLGLLQAAVLLVIGKVFFGLNLGNVPLSILNIVLFSALMTCISILIGSVFKSEDIIVGISVLAANIFAGLGGCWWPIEIVGPTFKAIGMISPAYWAMDAFHQIIFFNKGLSDITLNFVILLAYTIVFMILSVKFFKIKD